MKLAKLILPVAAMAAFLSGCGYDRSGALGGMPGSGGGGADLSEQTMDPGAQQSERASSLVDGVTPSGHYGVGNPAGTVGSGGERP